MLPADSDSSATVATTPRLPWYGLLRRSNFEKTTAAYLNGRGLEPYLPLQNVARRRSDRVVEMAVPLFPGYLFCRFDVKDRVPVLSAPGLVSIVGFGHKPAAIADEEIEAVQRVVNSGLAVESLSGMEEGKAVTVIKGVLTGLSGRLIHRKSTSRFVVGVEMLQRSVSVEIDRDWLIAAHSASLRCAKS